METFLSFFVFAGVYRIGLFLPQLHQGSLADLQQDVRCRDPEAERQVPGVALLLPDGGRPA